MTRYSIALCVKTTYKRFLPFIHLSLRRIGGLIGQLLQSNLGLERISNVHRLEFCFKAMSISLYMNFECTYLRAFVALCTYSSE